MQITNVIFGKLSFLWISVVQPGVQTSATLSYLTVRQHSLWSPVTLLWLLLDFIHVPRFSVLVSQKERENVFLFTCYEVRKSLTGILLGSFEAGRVNLLLYQKRVFWQPCEKKNSFTSQVVSYWKISVCSYPSHSLAAKYADNSMYTEYRCCSW